MDGPRGSAGDRAEGDADGRTGPGDQVGAGVTAVPGPPAGPTIVDWRRMGHRLRRSAVAIGLLVLTGWIVTGLVGDGVAVRDLGTWTGIGLAAMFVAELIVVGGAAVRGLLRAGDRGDRLARGDVGILPPQLTGRRR